MEMKNLLLVVIALVFFCFAAFADSRILSGTYNNGENVGDSWCIAKSTDTSRLKNNINFCCNETGLNCRPIQPGGSCFSPEYVYLHASYVMNLYYQKFGKNVWNCDFNGTGLIVTQNPSYDSCNYPGQ